MGQWNGISWMAYLSLLNQWLTWWEYLVFIFGCWTKNDKLYLISSFFSVCMFREKSWQDNWTSKARRGDWAGGYKYTCCITIWIWSEAWRCGGILWSICQGKYGSSDQYHDLHSNILAKKTLWECYNGFVDAQEKIRLRNESIRELR